MRSAREQSGSKVKRKGNYRSTASERSVRRIVTACVVMGKTGPQEISRITTISGTSKINRWNVTHELQGTYRQAERTRIIEKDVLEVDV